VLGFALHGPGPVVAVFGTIELVGNLLFVYNLARTLMAVRSARRDLLPMQPAARPAR
jgi:hypothetical protein